MMGTNRVATRGKQDYTHKYIFQTQIANACEYACECRQQN